MYYNQIRKRQTNKFMSLGYQSVDKTLKYMNDRRERIIVV